MLESDVEEGFFLRPRTEIYSASLTVSAFRKVAVAKKGKPHPAEEI